MDSLTISIKYLRKEFGPVVALTDLSIEVSAGSIFGFLGPNGAGKTTTIRLLLGLLQPTSGSVNVFGYDSQTQADQIRAQTGALLEHNGIYEQISAEDNLEFYGRAYLLPEQERKARIEQLLVEMGLWSRRTDRAGSWSRGMKQKLALARTFLHKPRLILLDEPTAGLDVQSAVAIRENLQMLADNEDVTIFITTHNMEEAEKLCDRVAVIQSGKVVAQGKPEELRTKMGSNRIEIIGRGFTSQILDLVKKNIHVAGLGLLNGHLAIDLADGIDPSEIVGLLVTNGAQIEEVRRTKASLEEVFLKLTGEENV
jgi:ABC-2 type transport system ATP-binding protein